ncbi:MAG: exosortase/archaeosortase family protein [Akkermansia sp.]|nr:exosortase/archaeosortase family protein [Akkermansia sp.]
MSAQEPRNSLWSQLSPLAWAGLAGYLLLVIWMTCFYPAFVNGTQSAAEWLNSAWNPETDYEHGWMVPVLSTYMLIHASSSLKGIRTQGSLHGMWLTVAGALLCVLAVRTQQGRVAIGALPFLLTGAVWCYWGGKAALRCAFPLFFLWMSIPLPGFQQATVGMQLLATKAAHWGAGICGVQTIMEGTNISSATGQWDTYSVAGGCSGMRSLMALIMVSTAWGYLADKLSLWKRIILALSAIPLSILANAFRVASIFICAEYINPAFASKTWHDWSGLLFFFPASLLGLMLLHGLLAGEVPFLKRRRTVVRHHNTPSGKEDSAS